MATIGAYQDPLLRLIRRSDRTFWDIYVSDWLEGIKPSNLRLEPTAPITMDTNGIRLLVSELKRCLNEKTTRDEYLKLEFAQNEPKFQIFIKYTDRKVAGLNQTEYESYSKKDKKIVADPNSRIVAFGAGINSKYQKYKDDREEMSYIYAGEGGHNPLIMFLPETEVINFISELEQELNSAKYVHNNS